MKYVLLCLTLSCGGGETLLPDGSATGSDGHRVDLGEAGTVPPGCGDPEAFPNYVPCCPPGIDCVKLYGRWSEPYCDCRARSDGRKTCKVLPNARYESSRPTVCE